MARNDKITIGEIETLGPERIVISPGPSTPERAGISNEVIRHFGPRLPLLGVCLGHQCIGHGLRRHRGPGRRPSCTASPRWSTTRGEGVLAGLPNPFPAIRYHSLVVAEEGLPDCLEVTAWTDDGTIMGLRHREHPVEGVQFHPESFMTPAGKDLLRNFLKKGVQA